MRRLASAVVLSLALTAPAFADTATPAPTTEQDKPASKDKSKTPGIVCTHETPTGSRLPIKVCTTPEQRAAQRGAVQRAQDHMQGAAPVIPN